MRTPILVFVLLIPSLALADPPTVKQAEAMLKRGQVEALFEALKPLAPGQFPEGDAKAAALLVRAAHAALKSNQALLAFDIADKATQLDAHDVAAYLVAADAAVAMGNAGFARAALESAQQIAPDNAEVLRRLGKLTDAAEAPPPPPLMESEVPTAQTHGDDEGVIPGYAARSSDHFRIVYSEGKRDFAQKAQYEQRCLDLFERAYQRVTTKLGAAPTRPTDVVLYTRDEFALHFGGSFGNSVLGFFAGKIRMNRAEAIDDAFFDTAVHEYTHAVISSIARGQDSGIPMWLHEGLARWIERRTANQPIINEMERTRLKRIAERGGLPSMAAMAHQSFTGFGGAAWVAYAKSSIAIDLLMIRGPGLMGIKQTLAAIGEGTPFETAFATEFGADALASLDDAVVSEINR